MTAKTLRIRLQNQYNKLNNRIQKSIKTGRFYQYTQFKRDQLFGRLERYALQMKRLSMGLGLVAALGVATPVVGQYSPPFVEHVGAGNPLDNLPTGEIYNPSFVDIDNDGDNDLFRVRQVGGFTFNVEYFENTGTAANPVFTQQTGANNPLDGATPDFLRDLAFVDIDNDGDKDLFAGTYPGYGAIKYYENTGTAANPVFVLQTNANNPLYQVTGLGAQYVQPAFVDIDNDGDQDCFLGASIFPPSSYDLLYYENTGTTGNPIFTQQTGANNPLNVAKTNLLLALGGGAFIPLVNFADMDADGDWDAYINGKFTNSDVFQFYENTGSQSMPNFAHNVMTPLDSVPDIFNKSSIRLVDLDGDFDLDLVERSGGGSVQKLNYFENLDTITYSSIVSFKSKEASISIYPNPTTGAIHFEGPITGRAMIYAISGQLLFTRDLEQDSGLDVSDLESGLYLLVLDTKEKRYRQKITILK